MLPRLPAALRYRNFALLWAGQAVSMFGDGILNIALPLQALRLVALLVGDRNWLPTRDGWAVSPLTGAHVYGPTVPSLLAGIPRWWWNSDAGQLYQLPALA